MHSKQAYTGQWIIDSPDPNDRLERQGEPVTTSTPVLIRHCQTLHYLASDNVRYAKNYGGECEVTCHDFCGNFKTQNLSLEKGGNLTTDVPTKFQQDQNHWAIIGAPNDTYAAPIEELHKFNIEDLIAEVKAKLLDRSSSGIKGIARIFKAMDDTGDRQLDVDDFRWGFIDYGFNLTKEEAQQLLDHFDRDKNGTVCFDEFLRALKVSLETECNHYLNRAT